MNLFVSKDCFDMDMLLFNLTKNQFSLKRKLMSEAQKTNFGAVTVCFFSISHRGPNPVT